MNKAMGGFVFIFFVTILLSYSAFSQETTDASQSVVPALPQVSGPVAGEGEGTQSSAEEGPAASEGEFHMDVVQDPICFNVKNEAPYSVLGSFVTDYYMRPDGIKARHRSNFRLEAAGSVHEEGYPLDIAEFCTYGPFYPDHKLEFVLRTIVPIFSCKTRVEDGDIVIHGELHEDGSQKTWADCYE